MIVNVYKQSFDDYITLDVNVTSDCEQITCIECWGTGEFEITPNDKQECVECKGEGEIWINC